MFYQYVFMALMIKPVFISLFTYFRGIHLGKSYFTKQLFMARVFYDVVFIISPCIYAY